MTTENYEAIDNEVNKLVDMIAFLEDKLEEEQARTESYRKSFEIATNTAIEMLDVWK